MPPEPGPDETRHVHILPKLKRLSLRFPWRPTRPLPPLALALVPAAVLALAGAGHGLATLTRTEQALRLDQQRQAADQAAQTRIARFSQDIGQILLQASDGLAQAGNGTDRAGLARLHAALVARLAAVDRGALAEIATASGRAEAPRLFDGFRSALLQATRAPARNAPPRGDHFLAVAAANAARLNDAARTAALALAAEASQRDDDAAAERHRLAGRDAAIAATLAAALLLLWGGAAWWLHTRLRRASGALDALAAGDADTAQAAATALAGERGSPLRPLAERLLALQGAVTAGRRSQDALDVRIRHIACLHDVVCLTERDDLAPEALAAAVAERLPSALRHPTLVAGRIELGEAGWGEAADGERLTVPFPIPGGGVGRVIAAYRAPVPAEAGPAFLAEERTLLGAIADRLAGTLARRDDGADDRDDLELRAAVFAAAPCPLELIDAATLTLAATNPAAAAALGRDPADPAGRPLADSIDEATAAALPELAREAQTRGEARIDTRRRHRDGGLIPVELRLAPTRHDGRDYLVASWCDRAETDSAEVEIARLAQLVGQCPLAVLVTAPDGTIVEINDAFVAATGFDRDAAIGQTPRLLRSGRTPAATHRALWEALARGESWQGELINRTRDGEERIFAALILPLRRPDGTVSHYAAFEQDVTDQRRLARELEACHVQLARLATPAAEPPPPAPEAPAGLDLAAGLRAADGEVGRFLTRLGDFLASGGVEALRDALGAADLVTARARARALTEAADALGAVALRRIGAEIGEMLASESPPPALATRFAELEAEFNALEQTLRPLLAAG